MANLFVTGIPFSICQIYNSYTGALHQEATLNDDGYAELDVPIGNYYAVHVINGRSSENSGVLKVVNEPSAPVVPSAKFGLFIDSPNGENHYPEYEVEYSQIFLNDTSFDLTATLIHLPGDNEVFRVFGYFTNMNAELMYYDKIDVQWIVNENLANEYSSSEDTIYGDWNSTGAAYLLADFPIEVVSIKIRWYGTKNLVKSLIGQQIYSV